MIAAVVALACGLSGLAAGSAAAQSSQVQGSSPSATAANRVGATPATTPIELLVSLKLADQAGAAALERAVSDPSSSSYRHFLTPAQWEHRFSPSNSAVQAVTSFLRSQGIEVAAVTPDRMTIEASGTAAAVERAFSTTLGQYRRNGHVVRLASRPLFAPAEVASLIAGIAGVDQITMRPAGLTGVSGAKTKPVSKEGREIPQPEGFRNGKPCSQWYGQQTDTTDPAFGGGYPASEPYAVCGYDPAQLQGAYGLSSQIASGIDGTGVTVAIVDAYAPPTLFADAHEYSVKNQPGAVLSPSQFSEIVHKHTGDLEKCEASGWFGESTLDVEAVHATAPGAHILYVGGRNCESSLFSAVQEIVDGHLAQVVTDSWGDNGGDLGDAKNVRAGFDNVLLMAAATGVGVQFSAGDEGDEFINFGANIPDYPPSSPFATSVGGTSLQVGEGDERLGELGWSTSKSVLCTTALQAEEYPGCTASTVGHWSPEAPGAYLYGGGGGTSYVYEEPWYQQGVVPAALAEKNTALTGRSNRVEPDISMVGDPTTGMLVGETQTFPDGVYYDQYRIGGTSLSSPLFAGVMADADQAAGGALGFANPLLYSLQRSGRASAFNDVVSGGLQGNARIDYLDGVDAEAGTITSFRTFGYEGAEEYCTKKGACTQQSVSLHTGPGFDSMTGLGSPGNGLIAALAEG
jgi:subtilase family serine protease